jgi:hypothetical protein
MQAPWGKVRNEATGSQPRRPPVIYSSDHDGHVPFSLKWTTWDCVATEERSPARATRFDRASIFSGVEAGSESAVRFCEAVCQI